jgi:nicotinic acid mononucleotide adenylyltransferase
MDKKVAVYGGSFNPFGYHHQDIVRWLVEEAGYSKVLVVPAAAHALKSDLPPYMHRYNMAFLGVQELLADGRPSLPFGSMVVVSQIEMDMMRTQPPPVRTYNLLRQIREGYPRHEIKFAIGPDIPDELGQWAHVDKIEEEFGFIHLPIQSMRATKLREMIRDGVESWRRHVPNTVRRYIEMHGLYRGDAR